MFQVEFFKGSVHGDKGTLKAAVNDWLREKEATIEVVDTALSAPNPQNGEMTLAVIYREVEPEEGEAQEAEAEEVEPEEDEPQEEG